MKRLDGYVRMRADNEINSEDLERLRLETKEELNNVLKEIDRLHYRAIDWISLSNQYLDFSKNALDKFEKGNSDVKRNILSTLGSNLVLIDKKLCISIEEPLLGLKQTHLSIIEKNEWLEPKKVVDSKGLIKTIDVPIEVGLPVQDSNL